MKTSLPIGLQPLGWSMHQPFYRFFAGVCFCVWNAAVAADVEMVSGEVNNMCDEPPLILHSVDPRRCHEQQHDFNAVANAASRLAAVATNLAGPAPDVCSLPRPSQDLYAATDMSITYGRLCLRRCDSQTAPEFQPPPSRSTRRASRNRPATRPC